MTEPTHPFDHGSYVLAALRGDPNDWRTHAARGILELRGGSAAHLAGFEGEETQFYRAVLHWLDREDDAAKTILGMLTDPRARALLALIQRPRIKVLSQMIARSPSPFSLYAGMEADPKFDVVNVDFAVDDWEPVPSLDVRDHVDPGDPPAFYIASALEWVPLLDNLSALDCPTFGHVIDPDFASQTSAPLYPLFDELIVNGAKEQELLETSARRPATVYPHCFALRDDDLQPIEPSDGGPAIDLLMTGTTIDVYHPDKRDLLRAAFAIDDCLPLIVHGYLPKRYYFRLYARARAIVSYVRHNAHHVGQGPETRILEAMAAGRPVLSLPDTVLELFFGEDDGLHTYDPSFGTLASAVRRLLRTAGREDALLRTARSVRRLYDHRTVASRYLRFLTVRAALCGKAGRAAPHVVAHQRVSGWTGFPNLHPSLIRRSLSLALAPSTGGREPAPVLSAARELILGATERLRADKGSESIAADVARARALIAEVITAHPLNLAARFMSIRASLHLGDDAQRAAGLTLLDETLAQPGDAWRLDPADHVMPFDFFPHLFDYRSYFEAIMTDSCGKADAGRRIALVLASLHAYRGWYGGARDFSAAKALQPNFVNYRLWAARAALLSGAAREATANIRTDLEDAARDPLTAQRATHLLCRFAAELYGTATVPPGILALADKMERCLLYVAYPEGTPGSAYERAWRLPGSMVNAESHRMLRPRGKVAPRLSVIVAPRPRRDYAPLLRSLAQQSIGRDEIEIVWADPFGLPPPDVPDAVDVRVDGGQDAVIEHLNRCYNAALPQASAPVVVVCDQTAPLPPQFLSVVASTFAERTEPLVLATVPGATKHEIVDSLMDRLESTVAFRRRDLLDIGGFDEAPVFAGRSSGPFDAAARIAASPSYMATIATADTLGEPRHVHAFTRDYLRAQYGSGRRLPMVENQAVRALGLSGLGKLVAEEGLGSPD